MRRGGPPAREPSSEGPGTGPPVSGGQGEQLGDQMVFEDGEGPAHVLGVVGGVGQGGALAPSLDRPPSSPRWVGPAPEGTSTRGRARWVPRAVRTAARKGRLHGPQVDGLQHHRRSVPESSQRSGSVRSCGAGHGARAYGRRGARHRAGGPRCTPGPSERDGRLRPHRPGWRNGRRGGLKIHCPKGRAGSNPAPGTVVMSRDISNDVARHRRRPAQGMGW